MTWTVDHIRKRIKEAAKTLERLPETGFGSGGYWPEFIYEVFKDDEEGNKRPARSRIPPTGRDIAEMEQTWEWINALPTKDERIECFKYGWIATRKGRTFAQYLEKNDIHRRNYERQIRKIFQKIADNLNRIPKMRNLAPASNVSQKLVREDSVTLEKPRPTHWMAPGAKPKITAE